MKAMDKTTLAEDAYEDAYDDAYNPREGPKAPREIVWRNVVLMSLLHIGALYGLTLIPSTSALTLMWSKYYCFLF